MDDKEQNTFNNEKSSKRWFMLGLIVLFLVVAWASSTLTSMVIKGKTYSMASPSPTAQAVAIENDNAESVAAAVSTSSISTLYSQYNPIPDIASSVSASVVGITNMVSTTKIESINPFSRGPSWGDELDEDLEKEQSSGSGIIISGDGYILTNNHVITGSDSIIVTLPGGAQVTAKVVGVDSTTDLALLKIDKTGLTAAILGDSSTVRVGELAIVVGNPLGEELSGTITVGVISAKDRKLNVENTILNLIQTDAAVNPGNSGGPLLNSNGEVIGILTAKRTYAGVSSTGETIYAEGISFAIPINDAKPIIDQLKEKGYVSRPGLGITLKVINSSTAKIYGISEGVYIASVTKSGPAELAGLKVADVITKINGTEIKTSEQVTEAISAANIGDKASLTILRSGTSITIEATIGDLGKLENGK